MRFLLTIFLLIGYAGISTAQDYLGAWLMTQPCDCEDPNKKEMTWQFTLKADGTYAVDIDVDGTTEITGTYSTNGNRMTVRNDDGCTEPGIYEFTVDAQGLWMDPIEDSCENRKPPKKVVFERKE